MIHKLPDLPYSTDALNPYIGKETVELHWGKHHRGYVNNLNQLITNTEHTGSSLESIIKNSNGAIFNNAAQIWNHNLYWQCMSPEFNQLPEGKMYDAIARDFGSFENFTSQFTEAGLKTFGSGWVWLVIQENKKLAILSTPNAENPLSHGGCFALLGCDVWEHAYYLDTQNNRGQYLNHFFSLTNWTYVSERYNCETS
tara:strand:- start:151 stop:744 length:594 start_codon:yes stop_codon:yes gene_type:complete